MRTGSDNTLLDRHSPKNTKIFQRESSHGMAKTWSKLRSQLRSHAARMADAVADSRASSGTEGKMRTGLLELLSLLGGEGQGAHFLDHLHGRFWRSMLSWCFDKPNNSVLQGHAYQLIFTVLKTKHEACLRSMLAEYDLAAQLRAAFELNSHRSMRGHILLIANSIRAAIDVENLSVAAELLEDNTAWKDFQSTLHQEASDQMRTKESMEIAVDPRIASGLPGLHMCPVRLFQPPPSPSVPNDSRSPPVMRTGMWNAEELSQEMLGKDEAEEQDRMLFDKLDGVAPMVCEEDADGEDGDALPLVDDEAGLAACLGFGAAASRSLSPPAVRMMPQAPQIPVHMSMSVPAEQPGAVRPSISRMNGTPRMVDNTRMADQHDAVSTFTPTPPEPAAAAAAAAAAEAEPESAVIQASPPSEPRAPAASTPRERYAAIPP